MYGFCDPGDGDELKREAQRDFRHGHPDREKYRDHMDDCNVAYTQEYDRLRREDEDRREEEMRAEEDARRGDYDRQRQEEEEQSW